MAGIFYSFSMLPKHKRDWLIIYTAILASLWQPVKQVTVRNLWKDILCCIILAYVN